MRRTTILLTAACLALVGCSSPDDPMPSITVTATTSAPAATPSLSQAETKRLCSVAVAEAAPGWEDWNYSPGEWQEDPRTPGVCQGLADDEIPSRGNRAFMEALFEGLEMADDPRADQ